MINCPRAFNLWADREKIASVIYNLLSNSIKYSPIGKQIVVDCVTDGDSKIFTVTDVGMGIKAQDLPRVFDRFYRSASKYTQNISGFGIGLYLSAEIIRLPGGKIWVESKIGVGFSFHFSLPESISDQDSKH